MFLRKVVVWIIKNSKNKYLIWKYNSTKPNRSFAKWWIEKNESNLNALYREIYEEFWIKDNIKVIKLLQKNKISFYSLKDILWKIKHKKRFYIWKIEDIFLLEFTWKIDEININLTKEFSEFKFVEEFELKSYGLDENFD